MFGKRFAYGYQGARDGDWTPPGLQNPEGQRGPSGHHGPFGGPRSFLHRGRGPFGGHGPFGHGGEGSRFFGRGDMKFALLALLQERPMYGYEMMKALEEKSAGFYTPSPGSIYPTLQMLEERGLVSAHESEGKKVYGITDAGRALLNERQQHEEEFAGPPWMRRRGFGKPRFSPELQALRTEVMEVVRLLTIAGRMSFEDAGQLAHLRGVIERTRKDLIDMIYGTGSSSEQSSAPTPPPTDGPPLEEA